jgi:hypothetical protein
MTTSSITGQPLSCRRCGAQNVWWATRKNGSYYMAVILPASPDHPHTTPIKRPHVCPSPEMVARRAAQDAKIERDFLDQIKAREEWEAYKKERGR